MRKVVLLLEPRKLVLLLAAALATTLLLTLAPGPATAQEPKNEVHIDPNAAFDSVGVQIHVNLHVVCEGGTGMVRVDVRQSPPETTAPASGQGTDTVVCDGRQHETSVTVTRSIGPGLFDTGRAEAEATLTTPTGTDTEVKTINIEVV